MRDTRRSEIDEAGHRRRLAEAMASTEANLDADAAELRVAHTRLDPHVKNATGCGANASHPGDEHAAPSSPRTVLPAIELHAEQLGQEDTRAGDLGDEGFATV